MKKKLICFKSLLFIAAFCAALGACRSDELVVREVSKPTAVAEKADTFSLKIDFPTTIHFDGKITATNDVTMADEANAEDKNTRAALHVNQDGTTTINLTTNGGPLKVFLILRNQDGSKVYVSADNTWNLVSGEPTKLEASGKYTFTSVKGGALALNKDEVWYLDAMTGGEWNEAKKAYEINKTCAIPKKMFNAGENVRLGTNMTDGKTDIVVPFLLGTDEVADAGERKWGVRMAVANDNRNSNILIPRLVCIDAAPSFMPYGSLLCMRFRNDYKKSEIERLFGRDSYYDKHSWRPFNYDYYIRGIGIESTSSTPGGWISVSELGRPSREDFLPWHPYKANGVAYSYAGTFDRPFTAKVQLDLAKDDNYKTGYFLRRTERDKDDNVIVEGNWTPYYYLWVKSLDETREQALFQSSGLKVQLEMYNATIDPYVVFKRPELTQRVVITSRKTHKTGRAYYASQYSLGTFAPSPLAESAVDVVYTSDGFEHWPEANKKNDEVSTSRYRFEDMQKLFMGDHANFSVHYKDNGIYKDSRLFWNIPRESQIKAIFPPKLENINVGRTIHENKFIKHTDKVSVAGVTFPETSYYYNAWYFDKDQSREEQNYHTYFALRYVGTPFCEAVRYTLYGRWTIPHGWGGSASDASSDSRFVIQAKHVGNVEFKTDDDAYKFLKNVVAAGNAPTPGHPHVNDFWGTDFWNPAPNQGIVSRVFHVPGQGGGGGIGQDIGRALHIAAAYAGTVRDPKLEIFEVSDGGRRTAYEFTKYFYPDDNYTWLLRRSKIGMTLIPMLAPLSQQE